MFLKQMVFQFVIKLLLCIGTLHPNPALATTARTQQDSCAKVLQDTRTIEQAIGEAEGLLQKNLKEQTRLELLERLSDLYWQIRTDENTFRLSDQMVRFIGANPNIFKTSEENHSRLKQLLLDQGFRELHRSRESTAYLLMNPKLLPSILKLIQRNQIIATMQAWNISQLTLPLFDEHVHFVLTGSHSRPKLQIQLAPRDDSRSYNEPKLISSPEEFLKFLIKPAAPFTLQKLRAVGMPLHIQKRIIGGVDLATHGGPQILRNLGYVLNPAQPKASYWEPSHEDRPSHQMLEVTQKGIAALRAIDELDLVIILNTQHQDNNTVAFAETVLPRTQWESIANAYELHSPAPTLSFKKLDGVKLPLEMIVAIGYLKASGYRYFSGRGWTR